MQRKILAAAIFALFAFTATARADYTNQVVASCGNETLTTGSGYVLSQDATGKLCVSASVTATVTGFTPGGTFATLTAAGTSGSVALPTGTTVAFQNTGTTAVSCTLGVGSATALANEIIVQAASTVFVTPGSNTWGACIDQSGSTSNVVVLAGGAGLGTGFGGGGGGSGGGTSSAFSAAFPANGTAIGLTDGTNMQAWMTALIQPKTGVNGNNMGSVASWLWNGASFDAWTGTAALGANVQVKSGGIASGGIASGAMVDLGAQADAAAAADNSTASLIALLKRNNQNLTTLNTTAGNPLAAGTNLIGKVGIDQTTPGTTNGVQVNAALPAGTNLLGKVTPNDGTNSQVFDPCQSSAKSFLPITATTSLVKVIATGVAAKKIYICQLLLTVTAADNVAVFEATTGTTCATSPVAVYGAGTTVATAANGFPFPANGGVSLGNGGNMVGQTTVANNDLCIGTSAATPLTGGITYVTQ